VLIFVHQAVQEILLTAAGTKPNKKGSFERERKTGKNGTKKKRSKKRKKPKTFISVFNLV
jgi:hypothetical protein